MKYRTLCTAMLFTAASLATQAQQAQPDGDNTSVNQPTQGLNSAVGVTNSLGLGTRNTNSLGLGTRGTNSLGLGTRTTNALGALERARTNLSSVGTNMYSRFTNSWSSLSNTFRGTNDLSPTSDRGSTNRIYQTNTVWMTNRVQMRDQAYTPADQKLLVQVRQTVRPLLTPLGGANQLWAPVHFICRDQTVTVVGYVPDQEQKQRIVTLVKQTPGVVEVIDQLQVNVQGGATATAAAGGQSYQHTQITQDQAFTAADRNILVRVRQEVQPVIGDSGARAPVHFICRDGIVTLVGVVPNEQQKQRIYQIVERTPGVVQVVNHIQVNVQANTALGSSTPQSGSTNAFAFGSTNQVGATNRIGLSTTNQFQGTNTFATGTNFSGANTNLTPTGRTNANQRTYEQQPDESDRNLPPGLRKRETLPPGLEKRDELPPGLEKRDQGQSSEEQP